MICSRGKSGLVRRFGSPLPTAENRKREDEPERDKEQKRGRQFPEFIRQFRIFQGGLKGPKTTSAAGVDKRSPLIQILQGAEPSACRAPGEPCLAMRAHVLAWSIRKSDRPTLGNPAFGENLHSAGSQVAPSL